MTAPNRNTLWGRIVIDEIVKGGVEALVIVPGSRSTPLTVAAARDDRLETYSHLDERSAGFFALGRGKRTGKPTAVLSTSGTAGANFHPAVIEAHHSRTPLIVLTADRPPELWDSGANQTIDQTDLYGTVPRFTRTLPEPEPTSRKLRALRTIVARGVAKSTGRNPGPVHLNVPFRKPLEPVDVPDDVPAYLADLNPEAVHGREGPYVDIRQEPTRLSAGTVSALEGAIRESDRGLVVVGPTDKNGEGTASVVEIASRTGFPVLADPLSGLRFGEHVRDLTVVGGFDGYIGSSAVETWPDPDVVIRFGASPISKALRHYLRETGARQFLVDPVGGWREATFTGTDLLETDAASVEEGLSDIDRDRTEEWHDRFKAAEEAHWNRVDQESGNDWEGGILRAVTETLPDPSTLFVSNSMPVRDLDRFAKPRAADITALGNRGASGIDGITSTGLGVGSTVEEPLVIVTGDLAYFHDMNGLLALGRFDLDATILVINNDGGGIFHMLPIEEFDPPFEEHFRTPHGLDFGPTGDLYDLAFARANTLRDFEDQFRDAISRDGTQVIEYRTDAERSHRTREGIQADVTDRLPR